MSETWVLRLYVAGQSAIGIKTFGNLKALCEQHLAGRYSIDVIDLLEHPDVACANGIVATPTTVREMPLPIRRVIGDLSNTLRTLSGLEIC